MTDDGQRCDLSVILISYNTRELTVQAIESFYRFAPPINFEMIVIDNDSKDSSAEAIAGNFPQVQLIRSRENKGFAAANNEAARLARGRRLLLLNPDTIHLDDATGALWAFAERTPERGIWGGRTLFPDHSLNPTSCWGRISLWSLACSVFGLTAIAKRSALFNPEGYGGWDRSCERDVDIVTGCFLMIDRSLWERLGGFDPAFFMYAEEADLCLRAAQLGARPGITPAATIVHYGGASEVSTIDKVVKVMRGRTTLIRKHWRPLAVRCATGLLYLWAGLRVAGSMAMKPGARDKWRAIWRRRAEWIAGY
ncbi:MULTISPECIES: glycosyltransferase family 2 protein [unclassified Sphingomonas]|uniref:glycosyltransferase family 2 protein n=1 Tax=unclassified Sphingomonas TaxID=196159 RepID=UPI00092B13F3|nr:MULTISPECIES: glycosyltransferase family 2 protein [unclassified Sphingomonas]MBN8848693.1 glycosyltransferase family 2 protein [Sphingomonas sp.]OJV28667.1 MAG: hypothetical protein BGO24_06260 [Sphingomonas sp. 67-36]